MEFKDGKNNTSLENALLQQVLEQSDICDVTIQVGEWRKKFHWCVLVMSPFFESLRRNNFIETQTGVVKLASATPLAIEKAILFLYGVRPCITEDDVYVLLDLSEFLLIPKLKRACVAFVNAILVTENNFMKILAMSSLYDFKLTKCYDFVRGNLREILQMKEMSHLTKDSLKHLLSDPLLSYFTAEEKFSFLVKWAEGSPQNKSDFGEVFQAIDFQSMDREVFETVIRPNSFAKMMCLDKVIHTQNTPEEHRVLIFTDFIQDDRTACFDLETEKWCGLDIGLSEGSGPSREFREYSFHGVRGPSFSDIYRVSNEGATCNFCRQDLCSNQSNLPTVSTVIAEGHEGKLFKLYINEQVIVAISNGRAKVKRRIRNLQSHNADSRLSKTACSSDSRHSRTVRPLFTKGNETKREVHIRETTLFIGDLQNLQTTVLPVVTISGTHVDYICRNGHNCVALLTYDMASMYIYDISRGLIHKVNIEPRLREAYKISRHLLKLVPTDDGFIIHNKLNATIVTISPSNEGYSVQHTRIHSNFGESLDLIEYFYCDRVWYRFLRRLHDCPLEFASLSHNDLMKGQDCWNLLPMDDAFLRVTRSERVFLITLPKAVLNCHFDCPHCKKEKRTAGIAPSKSLLVDQNMNLPML